MKKQIIVSAFGAMLLASCADHFDQNFETVRPDKLAEYGYLESMMLSRITLLTSQTSISVLELRLMSITNKS